MAGKSIHRRAFLGGAGVAMGLPMLDAMSPAFAKAAAPKRRLIAACTGLGLYAPYLFPQEAGRGYKATPYLDVLKDYRDQYTIFSGVSHPSVDGGHSAEKSFLTAAPHPGASSFKNSISLDQFAREKLLPDTRYGYLALTTGNTSISYSRGGIAIPAEQSPSRLFAKLFMAGTEEQKKKQVQKIKDGQSIMDTVRAEAKRMQGKVSATDRKKLDEYFTSVRELEGRLIKAEAWAHKPKPKVDAPPPVDIKDHGDTFGRQRLMYGLMHLALQTDSTRLVTLMIGTTNVPPPGLKVTGGWHNITHHGKDATKIEDLKKIEIEELNVLREFLEKLKGTKESGGSLLDNTMLVYGSNLGNAASHSTRNMPMLLAGGGFNHGSHMAYDQKDNEPVCNIYLSMLQKLGVKTDQFGSSTRTITGL